MDYFDFKNHELHCEDTPVSELAQTYGTPLYVYSRSTLIRHAKRLKDAFSGHPTILAYAVKANSNLRMLKEIFDHGYGADLVSGGELERAVLAGVDPKKCVFSGVGKTKDEIRKGLKHGLLAFNVESPFELDMISQVAKESGQIADVNLRINPNIPIESNPKISTGMYDNKFGMPEKDALELAALIKVNPHLRLLGLACHIGSQMTDLNPLREAARRLASLSASLKAEGHDLKVCDMGGGLGIRYAKESLPSLEEYADTLVTEIKKTGLTLVIEPGRVLVGNTGILVTRVLGIKQTPVKTFAVVDAAMNDLLRPAMYDSYHEIQNAHQSQNSQQKTYDIVGPICESSDCFGKDRTLDELKADDLVIIRGAGAYGMTMSSNYNSRAIATEVLVEGKKVWQIRRRQELNELWQNEVLSDA